MTDLRLSDPALADVSPAAKLVYFVLQEAGPCTLGELRTRTQLPDRTARRALETLQEADLVTEIALVEDCRTRKYRVADKMADK